MACLEEIVEQSSSRMKPLQPQMAVTTADIQRHTSQLERQHPTRQKPKAFAHNLETDMRKAAALKNELVEIIKERDDAIKVAGFTNEG